MATNPEVFPEEPAEEETEILNELFVIIRSILVGVGEICIRSKMLTFNCRDSRRAARKKQTHFHGEEGGQLADSPGKEIPELLIIGVANIEAPNLGQTLQGHISCKGNGKVLQRRKEQGESKEREERKRRRNSECLPPSQPGCESCPSQR